MAAIAGKVGALFQSYTGTDKHKLIADFQDDESWVSGAGTQSDDGTNYRLGTESIKILENDNTGSFLYSDLNSISLNLATFESGAASDTSDYIYLMFYVSDSTKVTNVKIAFSSEATFDGDPKYEYSITSGIATGWNYAKIKKSAFTNTNMSNWTSIQSIRIGWTSANSSQNTYISFQAIYLVDDSYDITLLNNTAYKLIQTTLCFNWSLEASQDINDTTNFSSSGWKENIPTLKGFTVSVEKYHDDSAGLTNLGTDIAIALYTSATAGYRYEGFGKVSSNSPEVAVEEVNQEGLEFEGNGQLYFTDLIICNS